MSQSGSGGLLGELQSSLPDRTDEPFIEPKVLNTLADIELPFRGQFRQRVIRSIARQARQRRTIDGIASRVASQVSAPITEEIRAALQDTVESGLKDQVSNVSGATRSDRQ